MSGEAANEVVDRPADHEYRKKAMMARVLAARHVNRAFQTKVGRSQPNPAGRNVLDRDWDNLLLLDACRYDYFKECASELPGELSKQISLESGTPEFIRATFSGRHELDTVYVSANSWWWFLADEIDSRVHRFINLKNYDCQDDIFNVELPETTGEWALNASDEYPNKRLIVHFNQPHHPHIGETGLEVFGPGSNESLLAACCRTRPDRETLQQSYQETLEAALPTVEELIAELPGKTVVTADHGEMLGERSRPLPVRDYGHNPGLYVPELVEVPWFEAECDERREIVAEEPIETNNNEDSARKRLKKLGYL